MQAGLSCLEGFFRDFSPLMAQRGPCGRRVILGLSKDERSTPLCHRPLARTGPYALPYPYVYVAYRRNAPSPRPQSRRAATRPASFPPPLPSFPHRRESRGGAGCGGLGGGGPPRKQSTLQSHAEATGGSPPTNNQPFPTFPGSESPKTLQTIHRRKTFKPAPPPRLQLRLRRVRRDQSDRCARRAPCGQS